MSNLVKGRVDIEKPRWDQGTYWGRAKHFFVITNPLNLLCTSAQLENAKDVVTRYRRGETLNISEDELWRAKAIYDSAFHPDTGEKMFLLGRMSAQAPMNMLITGSMLSFYKSSVAVIFWQWVNQSFNAIVNYTNRSGDDQISNKELLTSYVVATSSALVTAITFNHLTQKAPRLIQRLGPFSAVAAANFVNIPLVRFREIQHGTMVHGEDGKPLGLSKVAAKIGIFEVVLSRIGMAIPSMVLIPVMMNQLERKGIFLRYPRMATPFQIVACGVILTTSTPLGCALFPQNSSIAVANLEPELRDKLRAGPTPYTTVYYNKGL